MMVLEKGLRFFAILLIYLCVLGFMYQAFWGFNKHVASCSQKCFEAIIALLFLSQISYIPSCLKLKNWHILKRWTLHRSEWKRFSLKAFIFGWAIRRQNFPTSAHFPISIAALVNQYFHPSSTAETLCTCITAHKWNRLLFAVVFSFFDWLRARKKIFLSFLLAYFQTRLNWLTLFLRLELAE